MISYQDNKQIKVQKKLLKENPLRVFFYLHKVKFMRLKGLKVYQC